MLDPTTIPTEQEIKNMDAEIEALDKERLARRAMLRAVEHDYNDSVRALSLAYDKRYRLMDARLRTLSKVNKA